MSWPTRFTIKTRRDDGVAWSSANPVLEQGEVGWETDTRLDKIGDGITAWNDLPYRALTFYSGTEGHSIDLDARIPGSRRHLMKGNTTITIADPPDGHSIRVTIALEQDDTGSRTVEWPGDIRWLAGTEPTIAAEPGDLTVVELHWIGEWIGRKLG